MGKLIFDYVGNADMYWITDENGVFKASVKHFDDANRLLPLTTPAKEYL